MIDKRTVCKFLIVSGLIGCIFINLVIYILYKSYDSFSHYIIRETKHIETISNAGDAKDIKEKNLYIYCEDENIKNIVIKIGNGIKEIILENSLNERINLILGTSDIDINTENIKFISADTSKSELELAEFVKEILKSKIPSKYAELENNFSMFSWDEQDKE